MNPVDLLSKNLDLFMEMKKVAVEQEKMINHEDVDRFLDLAARRDHLVQQIAANDREYREYMPAPPGGPSDPEVTRTREDIIHLIRSIQEIDRKIEDCLTQKSGMFLSEIEQIRKGQKAIRGYGGNPIRPPRFINRQG